MSSSACQWISQHQFVFSSLVVFCFLMLFFTYYNNDRFPSFDVGRSCQPCPAVGPQIQYSNPNCSKELHINPNHNATHKIQAATGHTETDTIVLIWMWPFGHRFDFNCSIYNIKRCHLTINKTLYHKAHGVLFHHRDIRTDLAGMPKEPRPWFQKWVWFNMESPVHSARIPGLNHLFNLTCNYRLDSNIPVPYIRLVPLTSEDERFKLPAKDKLVCWIVSDWNPQYKRVHYYNELKKHIEIHVYGRTFGRPLSNEDYVKTVSSCKFYLSFENSICKDYITEKVQKPMMLGTVPVTLGPPRLNYEDHVPADSFIHVDDFSTPKELAERLIYLDQNNTEYMRYFNWTNRYKSIRAQFGKEHACRTCSYLQNHRQHQAFHDLNKWYWG